MYIINCDLTAEDVEHWMMEALQMSLMMVQLMMIINECVDDDADGDVDPHGASAVDVDDVGDAGVDDVAGDGSEADGAIRIIGTNSTSGTASSTPAARTSATSTVPASSALTCP